MSEQAFVSNGYEHITAQISAAVADKTRTATISGEWEISEAIRLPSNFTLILEDCHLRLADGCYCNMFVNANHDTDSGRTAAGGTLSPWRERSIGLLCMVLRLSTVPKCCEMNV